MTGLKSEPNSSRGYFDVESKAYRQAEGVMRLSDLGRAAASISELGRRSAPEAEHAAVGRRDANAAHLGGLDVVGEHLENGDLALDPQQRVHLHHRPLH